MVMAENDNGDDQKELAGQRSPWKTPVAETSSADAPVMGAESWPALGDAPPRPKGTDSAVKPPNLASPEVAAPPNPQVGYSVVSLSPSLSLQLLIMLVHSLVMVVSFV